MLVSTNMTAYFIFFRSMFKYDRSLMRTYINIQFYKIRLGLRIQIRFCRIQLAKRQIRSYLVKTRPIIDWFIFWIVLTSLDHFYTSKKLSLYILVLAGFRTSSSPVIKNHLKSKQLTCFSCLVFRSFHN